MLGETRRDKLEKEGIAIREPRQVHRNKEASVRRGEEQPLFQEPNPKR
jgi:hypothetical protein